MSDDATPAPVSFAATATALEAIAQVMRTARTADAESTADPERAAAALLLLREVREQLAHWEPALIETAREAGASWADLAHPLGVSSRQAAERRYLRVRPGEAGTTKEQRVQATRGRRAADRSVTSWANDHAASLRQLAGTITDLPDLPATAADALTALRDALGDSDPAQLLGPLSEAGPHLRPAHADLADRVTDIGRHTDEMRESEHRHRSSNGS
ncbi:MULTISPECIES: type III effector protein [unclassified Streptomyces]|uniref:type III effector protein n=1 Tax=unclassified Streptomyces TaxID=2593676 RepID=UPI0013B8316A|nr:MULTISPECIES: type III effector protein [unclassified Streptomyces]MCX5285832.1 type III effector protein [Streptomyces sp. NBC_00198]NEB33687.1 type III effector protein [Streptomyces sp. SID14446]WSD81235.1 type III effector protein [Streptomyces sp. NBC_01558]